MRLNRRHRLRPARSGQAQRPSGSALAHDAELASPLPAAVAWPLAGGMASLMGSFGPPPGLAEALPAGPESKVGRPLRRLGASVPFAATQGRVARPHGVRARSPVRPASRLRAGRAEAARGVARWPARVALWRRRLNHRDGCASQVCIDIGNNVSRDTATTISDCVYRALLVHAAGPGGDPLRIVTRHDAAQLVYPPAACLGLGTSPGIVMIQAPWRTGRPPAVEQSFYRTVVDMLHRRAGVGEKDVFIHLVDASGPAQVSEPRWISSIL